MTTITNSFIELSYMMNLLHPSPFFPFFAFILAFATSLKNIIVKIPITTPTQLITAKLSAVPFIIDKQVVASCNYFASPVIYFDCVKLIIKAAPVTNPLIVGRDINRTTKVSFASPLKKIIIPTTTA